MTPADSCHLKTADLETSSGITSVVLTADRIVVYVFCKQNSPLVRNTLEEGRQRLSFACLVGKFSAVLGWPVVHPRARRSVSVGFMTEPVHNITWEILPQDIVFAS